MSASSSTTKDGIPFSKLSVAGAAAQLRPNKSVMLQARSNSTLVSKWWGPISRRLEEEEESMELQNEDEEAEIKTLNH
eukprot:g16087.t1